MDFFIILVNITAGYYRLSHQAHRQMKKQKKYLEVWKFLYTFAIVKKLDYGYKGKAFENFS